MYRNALNSLNSVVILISAGRDVIWSSFWEPGNVYKYVMEKQSGDVNFYLFLLLSYQIIQDGG